VKPVIYKYKCDKTGLTYEVDKTRNRVKNIGETTTVKLEMSCPHCEGKHRLFAEEKNKVRAAFQSLHDGFSKLRPN
jgi:rubredoxin